MNFWNKNAKIVDPIDFEVVCKDGCSHEGKDNCDLWKMYNIHCCYEVGSEWKYVPIIGEDDKYKVTISEKGCADLFIELQTIVMDLKNMIEGTKVWMGKYQSSYPQKVRDEQDGNLNHQIRKLELIEIDYDLIRKIYQARNTDKNLSTL